MFRKGGNVGVGIMSEIQDRKPFQIGSNPFENPLQMGRAADQGLLGIKEQVTETVTDFAAAIPAYGLQAFTTPSDQLKTATELISGVSKDKDTPGPTTVPESEPAQMQATQEEAFDALVEDAREREEMYYKMLGEQRDPIGTLGKGFRQLGALYDEDRSKALAAAGDVMQADLDADK